MGYLDLLQDVKSWEYESFFIHYVSNIRTKKVKKYYPDFFVTYVDGSTALVEVKPLKRIAQRLNQKKFTAAKKWCEENSSVFVIVSEKEISCASKLLLVEADNDSEKQQK